MPKKNNKLKANTYIIINDCISIGIEGGWNRAHKHTDTPSEEMIKNEIEEYIMLQISEKFKFD